MALNDYNIDTSGSPQDVQRRQALADALMKQGSDSTPAAGGKWGGALTALNRGFAGALGGYERGTAMNEEQQGRDSVKQLMANQLMGANGQIDPQASLALAGNQWASPQQIAAVNHIQDTQHTDAQDAERKREWQLSFGLQQQSARRADQAADRANMSPLEQAQERLPVLQQYGIDPNSDAGKAYLVTGKLPDTTTEAPASVKEYQYYTKNFQPTPENPQPMDYPTFSVQKARAGATNISNVGNVGAENKGLNEAAKLDAETVRKGQNEQMPALDDADRNFQIMQDAIDRNGGKLPTGGILGKLGLDARRTSGYIRDNWGIDLGDDPTTATSLETFNKGGIKASGDMAKAIGGTRVLKVEFDMAQKANPGLETTDGGNKYLIDLNRNTIAIKRDHLQAQEDYWRDHNHSLDGFQKSWNAEVKANPRPLSNFSVAPPINNGDGTQFVKLPSTGQGGYTWYRKGQDGLSPVTDQNATSRLEASAKPLKADKPAPLEKVVGDKTYIKQDGNWFEKPTGAP